MKLLVITPTYNEAHNITTLLERLFSIGLDIKVLVIDDNSPDGTSRIVERLRERNSNLLLITRPKRLGLGSAYREGFRFAIEKAFDAVIQIDADLSHAPHTILEMAPLMNTFDLVIGSRYVAGGGVHNWSLSRKLLSKYANRFVRSMLAFPVHDATSGFKCVKTDVLKKLDFSKISSKGYAFQIEMVYEAFVRGCRITEYPIIFEGRKKEKSKMSAAIVAEAFLRVLSLGFCTQLNPAQ